MHPLCDALCLFQDDTVPRVWLLQPLYDVNQQCGTPSLHSSSPLQEPRARERYLPLFPLRIKEMMGGRDRVYFSSRWKWDKLLPWNCCSVFFYFGPRKIRAQNVRKSWRVFILRLTFSKYKQFRRLKHNYLINFSAIILCN